MIHQFGELLRLFACHSLEMARIEVRWVWLLGFWVSSLPFSKIPYRRSRAFRNPSGPSPSPLGTACSWHRNPEVRTWCVCFSFVLGDYKGIRIHVWGPRLFFWGSRETNSTMFAVPSLTHTHLVDEMTSTTSSSSSCTRLTLTRKILWKKG